MVLTTLQGDSINYENVTNHSFLGKFIIADEDPNWSNAIFWEKNFSNFLVIVIPAYGCTDAVVGQGMIIRIINILWNKF